MEKSTLIIVLYGVGSYILGYIFGWYTHKKRVEKRDKDTRYRLRKEF